MSSLGNFNAAIDQAEDEMQAFGRINELLNRMNESPDWKEKDDIPVLKIIEELKKSSGLGHFSNEQWKHFIALRQSLTAGHTQVLSWKH